jgi:hypothetical protein
MVTLLNRVGPDGAGHEFTKQLHDVVCRCASLIIGHSFWLLRWKLAVNEHDGQMGVV